MAFPKAVIDPAPSAPNIIDAKGQYFQSAGPAGPTGSTGPQGPQGIEGPSGSLDLLSSEPSFGNTWSTVFSGSDLTRETWVQTSNGYLRKSIDYVWTTGTLTTEVRKVISDADGITIVSQETMTYNYATPDAVPTIVTVRDI